MTYDRFQLLFRHILIFNPHNTTASNDAALIYERVTPWSDHIQHTSTVFYVPGTSVAVDECMVRYTGRSKETTRVPNKPIPVGYKVWAVAQQDYFLRWIWHRPGQKYGPVGVKVARRRRRKAVSENAIYLNPTQSVVVALLNLLPEANYHVFIDNLFSSCDLFRSLRQHGHGATGTARANCGIYKPLVTLKGADNTAAADVKFNEIRCVPTKDNQVNQIAWKDNALVLFLSTVFTGDEAVERLRKRPTTDQMRARPIQRFFGDRPVKLITIPSVAAAYNDEMNGVDRGDQLRSYLGFEHRVRRGGWQALAWTFLLDVTIINSYLLQLRGTPNWKSYMCQKEWRGRLVDDLMQAYSQQSQARQRFRSGDEFTPISQHKYVLRGKKANCLACRGIRVGEVRSQSSRQPLGAVSGNRTRRQSRRGL